MEYDYQIWKRKRFEDPERTYHFLRELMERQMIDDQTERNKVAQLKANDEKSRGYDPLNGGYGGGKKRGGPALAATEGGRGRGKGKGKGDELPRSDLGGRNTYGPGTGGTTDAKGRPTTTPPNMSEASRALLSKMHCYFWHHKGKCKYGNNCVMKHVEITEAVKLKLRHPSDIIADAKAKAIAAPAVPRDKSTPPDSKGKGRNRSAKGAGKGKGEEKGNGRARSRTPNGTPIDKTGGGGRRPDPKAKPKPRDGPHSPVPKRSESLGSQGGGLRTNKEIVKDLRIPGFCKDYRTGKCDRPIVGQNPTRCKEGCHVSDEVYTQMREKQKADIKKAKGERNSRSQSAPPHR
jgi:hypothetical protein